LVVITIIAVLAALTTAGVMRAMSTARQTGMKTELDQLDAALKAYKEKYGSYPPCNLAIQHPNTDIKNAARAALYSHIARAFPRYNLDGLWKDLEKAGMIVDEFHPDQALVFWLRGFSPDVTNPFVSYDGQQVVYNPATLKSQTTGPVKTTPFFEFDQGRLLTIRVNKMPSYFPRGAKVTTTAAAPYAKWSLGAGPYVYWDAASYASPITGAAVTDPLAFNANTSDFPEYYAGPGTAVPYWNDVNNNRAADTNETWANPDSFQIIATGLDGKYGLAGLPPQPRLYPTGFQYDPAGTDDDNVSNFCDRARMGDAKP
jgi:hypothetical protein